MSDDLKKRLIDWEMWDEGYINYTREEAHAYIEELEAKLKWADEISNIQADRIEELEAENKLLSEGVTIAHLRGAMDAHANRADDLWAEFKDKWDGERKYALRQILRWLKGTPGGEAEGE
jgi:hypothetical protein